MSKLVYLPRVLIKLVPTVTFSTLIRDSLMSTKRRRTQPTKPIPVPSAVSACEPFSHSAAHARISRARVALVKAMRDQADAVAAFMCTPPSSPDLMTMLAAVEAANTQLIEAHQHFGLASKSI